MSFTHERGNIDVGKVEEAMEFVANSMNMWQTMFEETCKCGNTDKAADYLYYRDLYAEIYRRVTGVDTPF